MSESSDHSYTNPRPSKYSKISQKTKEKLIQLVLQKNTKISSAAKILKIKHSTAKMIVGKYKKMLGKVGEGYQTFFNGNKNVREEYGESQKFENEMGQFLPRFFYFWDSNAIMGSTMGVLYYLIG